jgi:hypothetical protein
MPAMFLRPSPVSHFGGWLLALVLAGMGQAAGPPSDTGTDSLPRDFGVGRLDRLKYVNPGLKVDLGVGLWAWPVPIDFDGDDDFDLVVSCPDVPSKGLWFFENITGNVKMPIFTTGVRIGKGLTNVGASFIDGKCLILTPGREYPDFFWSGLKKGIRLPIGPNIHPNRVRANQWKYIDYDGDGRRDLIVGVEDWTGYGWDNAFNAQGQWTREPLHGYVYLLRNLDTNEKPKYEPPVKIEAGGKPIDTFGMPCPCFADFDRDGDLDLICGEFLDGFTYFENVGTPAKPRYSAGRRLKQNGRPIKMDSCMITPTAVDWDRNGTVDLIVGQEDGRVAFVENTGQIIEGMPTFKPPQYFQQIADEVKFGVLATPVSFDWDDDGDEDLICGNAAGYLGWIENLDGGDPPRWAAPKCLEADGKLIRIQAGSNGSIQGPAEAKWGYTVLSVADWNGDGLPDLVVNSIWGKVAWYRNIGTRKVPRLAAAEPIEVQWPGKPPKPAWTWWETQGKELATQWRTSPAALDWNGDGLCDLVMLDTEGYLVLFPRTRLEGKLVLLPPQRVFYSKSTISDTKEILRLNVLAAGRSGRRKFCFTDWDGDGRLDLIIDGVNAVWMRNVSSEKGRTIFQDRGAISDRRLAGHDTCPTSVGWSKDGVRDLLLGAEDGRFYFLRNPHREKKTSEVPH